MPQRAHRASAARASRHRAHLQVLLHGHGLGFQHAAPSARRHAGRAHAMRLRLGTSAAAVPAVASVGVAAEDVVIQGWLAAVWAA